MIKTSLIKYTFLFGTILLFSFFISCNHQDIIRTSYLGQGLMAGEITAHSAILQTRLTTSDTLIDGDLIGMNGWVRFEYGPEDEWGQSPNQTIWIEASEENDYIAKLTIAELEANQKYAWRAVHGEDTLMTETSETAYFRTNPGLTDTSEVSFVVVTGMNYYKFHFGNYDSISRYPGTDRSLGYPGLVAINRLQPDYFIGTGDNVYFDHPVRHNYERAIQSGKHPTPGYFNGREVTNQYGMRKKYHVQFVQKRFVDLFKNTGTYWMKDDHDYRFNDADPFGNFPISHELGVENFLEQLPVIDSENKDKLTYRTHIVNKDLQIWMMEGRDYRSANQIPDGPEKTLWGEKQLSWIKQSLTDSRATFKVLISPTPLVGPDDNYKSDNHVNPKGFKNEGDAFFDWLVKNNFTEKGFFIICGDRHWQYHAVHPSGVEEYSCGALVDNNSRPGRLAGDPESTDPDSLIVQKYVQGTPEEASGGFLHVRISRKRSVPQARMSFYDENGNLLHQDIRQTVH